MAAGVTHRSAQDGGAGENKFLDAIEGMMGSALVTTEKVKVIQYGTKRID